MCMPAPGDDMNVEIDEVRKPARAYMFDIPTAKKSPPVNLQHKPTMSDMLRYGLIHADES